MLKAINSDKYIFVHCIEEAGESVRNELGKNKIGYIPKAGQSFIIED